MSNAKVIEAINTTKEFLPDYWDSCLAKRIVGGAGSRFIDTDGNPISSKEVLEDMLCNADWTEVKHPLVADDCTAYKCNLKGTLGIIKVADLPDDTVFIVDDRKGTGKVSLTVVGVQGDIVSESYLITGDEAGKTVVFTFHAGEPISPSKVTTDTIAHGSKVSKSQALELGFEYAQVI